MYSFFRNFRFSAFFAYVSKSNNKSSQFLYLFFSQYLRSFTSLFWRHFFPFSILFSFIYLFQLLCFDISNCFSWLSFCLVLRMYIEDYHVIKTMTNGTEFKLNLFVKQTESLHNRHVYKLAFLQVEKNSGRLRKACFERSAYNIVFWTYSTAVFDALRKVFARIKMGGAIVV